MDNKRFYEELLLSFLVEQEIILQIDLKGIFFCLSPDNFLIRGPMNFFHYLKLLLHQLIRGRKFVENLNKSRVK